MKKIYAFSLFSLMAASLMAQQVQDFEDLEAVSKKGFFPTYVKGLFKDFTDFGKPFDYSGGFGINMRSYNALGTTPRQDPFLYTANANFNARSPSPPRTPNMLTPTQGNSTTPSSRT
ncbi:MAG: hypothetical protein MUC59_10175 [Saprospiraceae bacterium]|nr:hypothetical protein [Saprospiraceae bacterium]